MAPFVLHVSSNPSLRKKLENACARLEIEYRNAGTEDQAVELLVENPQMVLVCGLEPFHRLRERLKPRQRPCALLCVEPQESEAAIHAIKRGALDFLVHPVSLDALIQHLRDALRVCRDLNVPAVYEPRDDAAPVDRIVGQSLAMKEVFKRIGLIAPKDINVLITGESGTGKELVARAILHHSTRRDKPFLAVNCAAIPETLLESELFGHEKGAFTGAENRRLGKFEQCHGGTLFLDEIGDIPVATQAKLLRVLQDNTFQRLGGAETIRSDVRILAATHQPLDRLIAERRFRQDLFYRLNVASIHVPALRERDIDVVMLAHHFVNRDNHAFGTSIRTFSPEVLPVLLQYSWPGNVRELENAIKSALVVARGSVFRLEFLPDHIRQAAQRQGTIADTANGASAKEGEATGTSGFGSTAASATAGPDPMESALRHMSEALVRQSPLEGQLYRTAVRLAEQEIIRAALHISRGNLSSAARRLGISRTTLRKKMDELNLELSASVQVKNGEG